MIFFTRSYWRLNPFNASRPDMESEKIINVLPFTRQMHFKAHMMAYISALRILQPSR